MGWELPKLEWTMADPYYYLPPPKTPPRDATNFLHELAKGKHVEAIRLVQKWLAIIGVIWPPARAIARGLSLFLFINKMAAPEHVVSDGKGGFVPASNSRIHPIDGRFIEWNGTKWVYADFWGGDVKENFAKAEL